VEAYVKTGGENTSKISEIPCPQTCTVTTVDRSSCIGDRKTSSATRDDAPKIKEPPPLDKESSIEPAHANNTPQALLGPIDWIVATKHSLKTRRKVTGFARNFRPIDPHVTFIPDKKIDQLVKPQDINIELSRSRTEPLVTDAPEEFRKILTILYLLKLPRKIRRFVQRSVRDVDLPFDNFIKIESSGKRAVLRSRNRPDAEVPFEEAEDFVKHQWSALAFVFRPLKRPGVPHYKIPSEVILPFQSHRRLDRRGASGQVYKTRIHPDYYYWKAKSKVKSDNLNSRQILNCYRVRKTKHKMCSQ
jgi:hypothetical protein